MFDIQNHAVEDAIRPAIALKPLMPGEDDHDGVSCFGGDPRLPDMLDWPRDGEKRPMNFLCQIDCASIAEIDPDMPEEGTLFFFGSCNFGSCKDDISVLGGAKGSCVLYWPDRVDDVPERAPPKKTQVLGSHSFVINSPWSGPYDSDRGEREVASAYPPPPRFARFRLAALPFDSDPDSGDRGLIAALPAETDACKRLNWYIPWLMEDGRGSRYQTNGCPVLEVPDSFPFVWEGVMECASSIYQILDSLIPAEGLLQRAGHLFTIIPGVQSADAAHVRNIRKKAMRWIKKAAKHPSLTPIDPDDTAEFQYFLSNALIISEEAKRKAPPNNFRARVSFSRISDSIRGGVVKATATVIRTCIGLERADIVPRATMDIFAKTLRWERSLTPEACDFDKVRWMRPIQMLGHAPSGEDQEDFNRTGTKADGIEKPKNRLKRLLGQSNDDRDQVLLLQLPESQILNFQAQDSTCQFRIARDDLRKRAFDRASCTRQELRSEGLWRTARHKKPEPILPPDRIMPSIIFKPLLPDESGVSAMNYWGGKPRLPRAMNWPKDRNGNGMDFHMQIDLGSLPRKLEHDGRAYEYPTLPSMGGLFVFRAMPEECEPEFRLLYTPEQLDDQPEREIPDHLREAILSRRQSEFEHHPKYSREAYPKRSFDIVPYASCVDEEEMKPCHLDMQRHALPHEEDAVHRFTYVLPWLPNWYRLYREERAYEFNGKPLEPLIEIPASYPWRWMNIHEQIADFTAEDTRYEEASFHLWGEDIWAETRRWIDLARAHDPLDRIPPDIASSYRAWLINLDAAKDRISEEGSSRSQDLRRSHLDRTFKRMMNEVGCIYLNTMMAHIRHADVSDLPRSVIESDHAMFRYKRSFSEATDDVYHEPSSDRMFGVLDTGDSREATGGSSVTLLDLPLGWSGGGYSVRFTIAREALAAGKIEKAEVDIVR